MVKLAVSVSGGPFSTLEGKLGLLTRIKDCMVFANYVQYRDLTLARRVGNLHPFVSKKFIT